ncbi:uncharacterized protein LOC111262507 isoform X2 [Varroa jacobsoni]|nr:uncharacterized protein LOC111262507 isoform X2 [Varroa jacobsoni]
MHPRAILAHLADVPVSTKVLHLVPFLTMVYVYTHLRSELSLIESRVVEPNWMMSVIFFTHGPAFPENTINSYFGGKISIQQQRQLTPNGKIQMRCLGEYLRAHYNPHCLEAAAFVSPVKRCNDSIYYVYQGLFNASNIPLESQTSLPAGDDTIARRSLMANMGPILNRMVHYPAKNVNSFLQGIINASETTRNRLKPDTVIVDVLLSALADGQKLDERLANVSLRLLSDMEKAILTAQTKGFQYDLVQPIFQDLRLRLQNVTDTSAVPNVNLALFCLTPLQLAATFRTLLRNEYSFSSVFGDAFEFKVYSGGRVLLNSISANYNTAGNLTYNYVSSSYGRYLTLDELIGNIAELALTTSPSVPSKAGTSILTRTTNVTAQSALAAVNKTAIFS